MEPTDVVALGLRPPHPAPQIRIDGDHQDLNENTAVERDRVKIDGLGLIVDGRLSGDGVAYDAISA